MSKTIGLLYTGHTLDILKELPDESVQMCVTSPPYWGLRDYKTEPLIWGGDLNCEHDDSSVACTVPSTGGTGTASAKQITNTGSQDGNAFSSCGVRVVGAQRDHAPDGSFGDTRSGEEWRSQTSGERSLGSQCNLCGAWKGSLGNEPTPELFIEHLVMVFREVHRVLRGDGTLWVNIGDSYNAAGRTTHGTRTGTKQGTNRASAALSDTKRATAPDLKQKDLVGIPWMLAFALRADGWWLRQDIIWGKKNPMPESLTDRCVKAHEYVFLLSKSKSYYFDHIAIQEPAVSDGKKGAAAGKLVAKVRMNRDQIGAASQMRSIVADSGDVYMSGRVKAANDIANGREPMRNKRSVWTLSSKPFKEAHFATFPETLIEPMILAGTSEHGCCAVCGIPHERVTEKESIAKTDPVGKNLELVADGSCNDGNGSMGYTTTTLGWNPACTCSSTAIPCTVLDPFSGAATSGKVALEHGRNYIGIELNTEYQEIARKRLSDAGLDVEVL